MRLACEYADRRYHSRRDTVRRPGGSRFALLSDIILSSASKEEHEADASGVFSTTSKLGDSLGTALIGAILVSSTFAALSPAIEKAYSDQLTVHELKEKLPAWVHRLKTTNLQLVRADHNKTTRIVNETISDSMHTLSTASRSFCLSDLSPRCLLAVESKLPRHVKCCSRGANGFRNNLQRLPTILYDS